MNFDVTIDEFNGPLDLMLHLIATKKLDLMNLDINELTTQYIAYIKKMEEIQLEIASEYLVELANLIMIKSHRLLPIEQEDMMDNYEENPEEKLRRRLIEYSKIKETVPKLEENFEERMLMLSKPQSEYQFEKEEENNSPLDMNTYDLIKAWKKMMYRIALTTPQSRKYETKEVSVDERRVIVRHILASSNKKIFKMDEILNDCVNMQEYVITFVVLLDMASHGEIHFNFINEDEVEVEKGAYTTNGVLD